MIPSSQISIAAAGDLALAGPFVRRAQPPGGTLLYPFHHLGELLRDTDLFVVNLEGPLSTDGPQRPGRTALLHNDPAVLDWLGSFPNCICSLANNHTTDYGAECLKRTQELLAARGIHYVGAGLNSDEAQRPLLLTIKDHRISVFAFTSDEPHVGSVVASPTTPGCCGLTSKIDAVSRISSAAATSDFVLVLLHTGFEYFSYPTPEQVEFARALVDAGATMVIGHHPHVQQGVEARGKGLICHSLGNLLLPEMPSTTGRMQYRKPVTKQFAIMQAEVCRNTVRSWRILGGRCDSGYRLVPYFGRTAARFQAEIDLFSSPLARTDYSQFWSEYSQRRQRELGREAFRDAVAKLARTNPATLLSTLSLGDITRNLRRFIGQGRS